MDKKRIAVIFGGESSEHEVSCKSGAMVIRNIDLNKYDVMMIGITEEGNWLRVHNIEDIVTGAWKNSKEMAIVSPDKRCHGVLVSNGESFVFEYIDVVFPILHGLYGEDGTIQGLLEMAGIPYVGCGVLASSTGMDKLSTKKIVDPLGIRQADYVPVFYQEGMDMGCTIQGIQDKLSYPVFVKPSNAGSSKGVSKASNQEELRIAIEEAALHDHRILVEETIVGREVECAVLGGYQVKASGIGEILAAAEFYDFDAKYNNAESRTVIDPELPEGVANDIQSSAIRIFKALDGFGLSRVDFFVEIGRAHV